MTPHGRLTIHGSEAFERALWEELTALGGRLVAELRPGEWSALLLIGGYGRGEGGVARAGSRERPHNNLDLLLVTNGPPAPIRRRLASVVRAGAERLGCGVDLGVVSRRALSRAPCRLLWLEARYGHKLIVGDPGTLRLFDRFRLERLPPREMRDLVANRATLLVLNDLVIATGRAAAERSLLARHLVKAVLGFGDALLYFRGGYHPFALERRRRLRGIEVPAGFRALYEEAVELRLRPDPERLFAQGFLRRQEEIRGVLERVHLEVEALRLGRAERWEGYAADAFAAIPGEDLGVAALARRARQLLRPPPPGLSGAARLGLRVATDQERLAVTLPVVAYGAADAAGRELAAGLLGVPDAEPLALKRAYLEAWARHGDTNAGALVARLAAGCPQAVAA